VCAIAGGVERFPRNEWGCFFRVHQPNRWRLKREARREAERAAATAAATAVAAGAKKEVAVQAA
jgi:hypothetical protein